MFFDIFQVRKVGSRELTFFYSLKIIFRSYEKTKPLITFVTITETIKRFMQNKRREKGGIIRAIKRQYNKGVRMLFHRKGHGVHSPFVFNFIIRVIEEKARYYAYDEIEEAYRYAKRQAKKESLSKPLPLKYHKLTYRVANRFSPQTILELGSDCGVTAKAMTLAATKAQITTLDSNAVEEIKNYLSQSTPNLIYIHACKTAEEYKTLYAILTPRLAEYQTIVVEGVRQTKEFYKLFNEFALNNTIKVTIDLYDIAILVSSPKLNKQTFRVGF